LIGRRRNEMVRAMKRESFVNTRLFVAASFIAICVIAVALLGTAA
jgi:hypothetical protein